MLSLGVTFGSIMFFPLSSSEHAAKEIAANAKIDVLKIDFKFGFIFYSFFYNLLQR